MCVYESLKSFRIKDAMLSKAFSAGGIIVNRLIFIISVSLLVVKELKDLYEIHK